MIAKVQKKGNSFVISIPKAYSNYINIENESLVDISTVKGKLVIGPSEKPDYTLKELLKKITKNNLHSEIDTGWPKRREVWQPDNLYSI
ncbi:MAG: AbrB/MazE/SpoVT family DNA-binding domain-containing protein [Saprospiraceae bacterium]|nr:AbrB/MazE/SpoVT family DNA-binding domain-containing protein [Saprospiraceae bacterium]